MAPAWSRPPPCPWQSTTCPARLPRPRLPPLLPPLPRPAPPLLAAGRDRQSSPHQGQAGGARPHLCHEQLHQGEFRVSCSGLVLGYDGLVCHIISVAVTALNPILQTKQAEAALVRLQRRCPDLFTDLCLYSDVCTVLSVFSFRFPARKFIQELFLEVNFEKVTKTKYYFRPFLHCRTLAPVG